MINSRTGIFANSLHKIFLFVSPPFYLTCSCTCGEPEKSPPPSAWLIFSPSIARIDFSDPPPTPKNLAPFCQPAPTWGLLPVLPPGFAIYLCILCAGVGWTPTLLPAFPPQEEREAGMGSWLLKEELSFHWQQGTLLCCAEDSTSYPTISRTLQRKRFCRSEER